MRSIAHSALRCGRAEGASKIAGTTGRHAHANQKPQEVRRWRQNHAAPELEHGLKAGEPLPGSTLCGVIARVAGLGSFSTSVLAKAVLLRPLGKTEYVHTSHVQL